MNEMSERISALIAQSGLSYSELEKLTEIPRSALQRYATGATNNIPVPRIEKMASALNSTAAYIMGWEEPTKLSGLFAIRRQKNLTQEALAEKVGTTALNIRAWETGQSSPSGNMLVLLADALGVTTDQLLGAEQHQTSDGNQWATHDTGMPMPKERTELSPQTDNPSDTIEPAAVELGSKLLAAYGDTPPNLTEAGMRDVAKYLRFVAEQEKLKDEDK